MTSSPRRSTENASLYEEKRSSGMVERRISLWMSQSQESLADTITSRRMQLHVGRQDQVQHPETIEEVQEPSEGRVSKEKIDVIVDQIKAAVADEEPPKFDNDFHREMYFIIESYPVQAFIFIVIILNTLTLCLMTSETVQIRAGWYLDLLDTVFIGIYFTEMVVKLYVYRHKYFFSGWNILDFVIVILIVLDLFLPMMSTTFSMFGATSIFRVFRVIKALRALRLFKMLNSFRFFWTMQVILTTIKRSMPGLTITGLMMFYIICTRVSAYGYYTTALVHQRDFFDIVCTLSCEPPFGPTLADHALTNDLYFIQGHGADKILPLKDLFSVIGRELYGDVDFRFRSIAKTMFTLYLMLTLDDWYFIPLAIEDNGVYSSFYYLFVYIFVNVYIFINIYVAVICDNFQNAWLEEKEKLRERKLKTTGSFTNMKEELEDEDMEGDEEEAKKRLSSNVDGEKKEGDDDDDDDDEDDDDENDSHEKTIDEYYPELQEEQTDLLARCFLVASSLELHQFRLMELHHVLDMMVDVAADASDDTAY